MSRQAWEARVGAEPLQTDQPAVKPVVHHCGYNALTAISTSHRAVFKPLHRCKASSQTLLQHHVTAL